MNSDLQSVLNANNDNSKRVEKKTVDKNLSQQRSFEEITVADGQTDDFSPSSNNHINNEIRVKITKI